MNASLDGIAKPELDNSLHYFYLKFLFRNFALNPRQIKFFFCITISEPFCIYDNPISLQFEILQPFKFILIKYFLFY